MLTILTTWLIRVIAVIIGAIVGLTFADIDLAPPIPIRHRSAWTHGPLVPLVLMLLARQHDLVFVFTLGFLPAYVIHLLADMLPKRWHGGALISTYPVTGWRMPAVLSLLWLAAGVAASVWVLLWMMANEYKPIELELCRC